MKFRIIERSDGKFQVQHKRGFFYEWHPCYPDRDDYLDWSESTQNDRDNHLFSIKELAISKLRKLTAEYCFKVIEEVSV